MPSADRRGLSPAQRQDFEDRGLVRLEGAIAPRAAGEMADRLWTELDRRFGMQKGRPGTWRTERPNKFQALERAGAFDAMASPAVRDALDELLGEGRWAEPAHWGQVLACFPGTDRDWDVPYQSWHLDAPAEPASAGLIGRVFAILAPLAPLGGGTLIATGSHRIVQAIAEREGFLRSGDARKRLQAHHPWFADLMSRSAAKDRVQRFMEADTLVDGVRLRVEPMTGEPGDVILMHPRILHAAAPNALRAPRLVLTQFVGLL
jgi:ectoine hydroxylase-related dioxygenase (phytanoyl-CoA dioxygenase family)